MEAEWSWRGVILRKVPLGCRYLAAWEAAFQIHIFEEKGGVYDNFCRRLRIMDYYNNDRRCATLTVWVTGRIYSVFFYAVFSLFTSLHLFSAFVLDIFSQNVEFSALTTWRIFVPRHVLLLDLKVCGARIRGQSPFRRQYDPISWHNRYFFVLRSIAHA